MMRKELWSKSEHGKCRISCSMCLFRFSSPSQMPWQSLHRGVTALGVVVGFGADPHSPNTDPHALFCFSAQDWDGSVIFLICKLRCEQENLSLFSPHKMGQDLPLHCSPWKTCRSVPQVGHLAGFNLNVGTCFPECCTAQRSCFSLMLKNSGMPPQAHSCAFW